MAQMTAAGVGLKTDVSSDAGLAGYAHTDDYYAFGMIEEGNCRVEVDFEVYDCGPHEVVCIRPGQVHRPLSAAANLKGWLLMVDAALMVEAYGRRLDELTADSPVVKPQAAEAEQLTALLKVLAERRTVSDEDARGKSVEQYLALAAVGIVLAAAGAAETRRAVTGRYAGITTRFKELLERPEARGQRPSWFAEQLNISVVYLNEAVKAATGRSVGANLADVLVVRTKRLLLCTNKSVKEIAAEVGLSDSAYLTRVFTRVAGISPSGFRAKYRE